MSGRSCVVIAALALCLAGCAAAPVSPVTMATEAAAANPPVFIEFYSDG